MLVLKKAKKHWVKQKCLCCVDLNHHAYDYYNTTSVTFIEIQNVAALSFVFAINVVFLFFFFFNNKNILYSSQWEIKAVVRSYT